MFKLCTCISESGQMWSYLSFCKAEAVRELLPLCSHNVVVFFKRVLEPEQLRRRKRRANPFGLPGECVVQKEALRTRFVSCNSARNIDRFLHVKRYVIYVTFVTHRHYQTSTKAFVLILQSNRADSKLIKFSTRNCWHHEHCAFDAVLFKL